VLDAGADRDEARRRLLALPGIGPWTADYIAVRALRDPDAFLASDLGVRHALEGLGCDGRRPSAERLAEGWRPYRAYALQYLWATLPAAGRDGPRRTATDRDGPRRTATDRDGPRQTAADRDGPRRTAADGRPRSGSPRISGPHPIRLRTYPAVIAPIPG
jgi:hypothetical protein